MKSHPPIRTPHQESLLFETSSYLRLCSLLQASPPSSLLCHLNMTFKAPWFFFYYKNSPFDVCMLICGIALIPFQAVLLRPPSSSRSSGCLWRWVMTAWFSRPRPQLPAYLPPCRWVEASGAHQEQTSECEHNLSTKDRSTHWQCGSISVCIHAHG